MKCAARCRGFEERAQLHEAMTTATRIKHVEGDCVALVARERLAVRGLNRRDSPIVGGRPSLNLEADQASRLATGVDVFHNCFDFFRRQLGGDEKVFEGNQRPDIVHGFRTGREIVSLVENSVHCAVESDAAIAKGLYDGGANERIDFARPISYSAACGFAREIVTRSSGIRLSINSERASRWSNFLDARSKVRSRRPR